MRVGQRAGAAGAILTLLLLAVPSAAQALAISVPSTVNLGSVPTGTTTLSHSLGEVTVSASGLIGFSFMATVSTTTFTSGGQTIPLGAISYWSGPATATVGLQTPVPGQVDAAHAVALTSSQPAFSSTGLVLSITTTWNPTILISIPAAAVAGTYTGTITHSVA
jgi:hypothetical protein